MLEVADAQPAAISHRARELVRSMGVPTFGYGSAMARALHREIEELRRLEDPQAFAETRDSCQANIEQITRLIADGGDPAASVVPEPAQRYVRSMVRRRVPLAVLLRSYRLGHRFLYVAVSDVLRRRLDDPVELASALDGVSRFLFDYIDVVSGYLAEHYETEQERWVRSAAAVRAETAADVLSGATLDADVASRRLGYALGGHHVGLVVEGDLEIEETGRLEAAAMSVAVALGGGDPLLIPSGASVLWAWCRTTAPPDDVALRALESHQPPDGVRIAIGRPGAGIEGFRVTHEEALHAARICARFGASGPSRTTTYESIELVSLLAEDRDRALRFVRHQLGPLAAPDEQAAGLRETVLAYLRHGRSPSLAAEALHMHKNTVSLRVKRAEALLGGYATHWGLELQAALTLAAVMGPDALAD